MSCLLREGAIDASTTEAVIERQVAAGGQLDTALLELEVVEENPLLGFYASACGLQPVTRRDLLRVSLASLQL